jgi:hypothetical protein
MARFTSAPVGEVIPRRRQRQTSQRVQIQREYEQAVRDAIVDRHEALVVELEPDDKALTVRNRIKRAADALGITGIIIRRRKERIIAYDAHSDTEEA